MKKLLLGYLLLCSVGTYAEETHELPPIQGWWPDTQSFSSLVSGVVQPQVNNGMTPYGTSFSMVAHAQMVAAQEAAKKAAAAAKAAKKQECMDNFQELDNLNYEDSIDFLGTRRTDCHTVFANDPAVMDICQTDAVNHYGGSLKGQADLLEVREEWCEKRFGN